MRKQRYRVVQNTILFILISLLAGNSFANEFYSLNIRAGEESNVSRGIEGFHELGSLFLQTEFALGKRYQLGLNDSLTIASSINYSRFLELPGFDRWGANVSASYRYKFGFGPAAPSLHASASYGIENSDGLARDTNTAGVEIGLEKRFQSGFLLSAGMDYQRNYSDLLPVDQRVLAFGYDELTRLPFELFDFESASVFAGVEYALLNGWMTNLSYRRINGATVASTTEPSLAIYKVSNAFYSDPAFGQNFSRPWFAYQIESNTNQWGAGVSIPVLQDTSIDFAFNWNDIKGPSVRDYENTIYAFTLTHNF